MTMMGLTMAEARLADPNMKASSSEMSAFLYGMASDSLARARLFRGNTGWFLDELLRAENYRERARYWRKRK